MGIFRIFKEDGELISEFPNHFVDGGKQFTLDFMFGKKNWLTGSEWSIYRYIGVGRSTDTNAGVTGPTTGTSVPIGGTWGGAVDNDWKLTSEITGNDGRTSIAVIRTDETAHIYGRITDANVDYSGASSIDIYEIGIFLASGYEAVNDPTSVGATDNDKANAMLIRGISYFTQGSGYFAKALKKIQGEDLIVQYVFADFEG